MRDPQLSTLFVVSVEVGLSYLAAMRGIEYVRRMAWLQVVLAVLIASHVTSYSMYGASLVSVYLSVIVGLAVADVEMNTGCRKIAMVASARDALSVMLSAAFLILPIVPEKHPEGNSTFLIGGALCVVYGVMYTVYHYAARIASLARAVAVIVSGNVAVFALSTLGTAPSSMALLEFGLRIGVSLLVFSAVHLRVPEGARRREAIDL